MSEKWYIIFTEKLNAYDLVEEGNVVSVGKASKGDTVTFFYKNKPFIGKITEISDSYDAANKILKDLGTEPRPVIAKPARPASSNASEFLGRRTRQATDKFSAPATSNSLHHKKKQPNLSEEEATRRRILEKNKALAIQKANAEVMETLRKRKMVDPDYDPLKEDDTGSDIVSELNNQAKQRKQERISGISKISPNSGSPSKEFLKQQVLDLQRKLQFAYDSDELNPESNRAGSPDRLSIKSTKAPSSTNTVRGDMLDFEDNAQAGQRKGGKVDDEGENEDGQDGKVVQPDEKEDEEIHKNGDEKRRKDSKKGRKNKEDTDTEETDSRSKKKKHTPTKGASSLISLEEDTPELDYQLRGDGEKMVLLHKGIFCLKKDLRKALKQSSSVTHAVRRIMIGVFKPSQLTNVTLTGTGYKPAGKKNAEIHPLHPKAIQCIVDYANEAASQMGWTPMKFKKLTHTISVKLNEIKTAVAKGKLKDDDNDN